jgi:hypothetical protein
MRRLLYYLIFLFPALRSGALMKSAISVSSSAAIFSYIFSITISIGYSYSTMYYYPLFFSISPGDSPDTRIIAEIIYQQIKMLLFLLNVNSVC